MILTDIANETRNLILSKWLTHIKEASVKNNGKVPYGLVSKVVRDNSDFAPWLTRDIINHHLKKDKKALAKTSLLPVSLPPPPAVVSPYPIPANVSPSVSPANDIPCNIPANVSPSFNTAYVSPSISPANDIPYNYSDLPPLILHFDESDDESDDEEKESPPLFRPVSENCGRPKGSTANKRQLTETALSAAKNQIADMYSLVAKKA